MRHILVLILQTIQEEDMVLCHQRVGMDPYQAQQEEAILAWVVEDIHKWDQIAVEDIHKWDQIAAEDIQG